MNGLLMNTIYVLWLRQLKRYFRSTPRLVGSLAQPLMFLVALGFGFGSMYEKAGGGDYIQFLAPGIMAMSILFLSITSGMEIIRDKQFGFLKETLVAPVPRVNIMLGRTLGGATIALFQGIIVFGISLLIGFRPDNWRLAPVAVLFMFLIAMFFTALGTAIASKLNDMSGFQLIMNFLVMPIFFLSGAIFPLDTAPSAMKIAAAFNPLSYGVDGIRAVLSGISHYGIGVDFLVLGILCAVILAVGIYFFSRMEI